MDIFIPSLSVSAFLGENVFRKVALGAFFGITNPENF
jgi:hypothetical protein